VVERGGIKEKKKREGGREGRVKFEEGKEMLWKGKERAANGRRWTLYSQD